MSISTTSGSSSRAPAATASSPSAASPTTRRSGSASSSARNPARTSAWSSASSTPDHAGTRSCQREPGRDPEAAVRPRTARRACRRAPPARSRMPQQARSPSPTLGRGAGAVVDAPRRPAGRLATQPDGRGRRPGVPADVGQRLLHDPVRGQLDGPGSGRRRSRHRSTGRPAARRAGPASTSSSSAVQRRAPALRGASPVVRAARRAPCAPRRARPGWPPGSPSARGGPARAARPAGAARPRPGR